jgi:hypothetical protein
MKTGPTTSRNCSVENPATSYDPYEALTDCGVLRSSAARRPFDLGVSWRLFVSRTRAPISPTATLLAARVPQIASAKRGYRPA